uniref:Uncharacterized protein n=1 Tax=Laurencia australis TaxID=3073067 RepID=A0AA51NEM9_9FLOR|nr:hypothetical protein [Laurencia australis]WMP11985.1 hypothetical protein [Laurencia australis]
MNKLNFVYYNYNSQHSIYPYLILFIFVIAYSLNFLC